MKKRVKFSFRATPEDNYSIREGYEASGSEAGFSGYVRDVLTGAMPHPNFDPEHLRAREFSTEQDLGKLKTSSDFRHHYQAVVLAALMLRIKSDPDFRKYIEADKRSFESIIKQIRGYDFDDKSRTRKPLPKKRRSQQEASK